MAGKPWRGDGQSFAHRLKGTLGKKRGRRFSLLLKASFLFMEAAGSLLQWVSFCQQICSSLRARAILLLARRESPMLVPRERGRQHGRGAGPLGVFCTIPSRAYPVLRNHCGQYPRPATAAWRWLSPPEGGVVVVICQKEEGFCQTPSL